MDLHAIYQRGSPEWLERLTEMIKSSLKMLHWHCVPKVTLNVPSLLETVSPITVGWQSQGSLSPYFLGLQLALVHGSSA